MEVKNDPITRWLYMREGDMLEYRDRYQNIKMVGPIAKIDWRPDRDEHDAPTKKYVLVPALREPTKLVSVPLERVQAVIRDGVEVIRFHGDEQHEYGCAGCHQRKVNREIAGRIFCSLHCQQEWIANYYGDYAPGQNPIDKGEYINTVNCGECRRKNRVYCPKCVD